MSEVPALDRSTPRSGRPPASPVGGERTAGAPQLALLLAGSCMTVLAAVLVAPVLPSMAEEFAGTPGVGVLVPVVLTAPMLMIGLTAPFAGAVVDRVGRVRLLLVAMLAYAACGTAPLYLQSLGAILASRVLVGLCEGAIITCCTTLIGDYWSGARRSRYLGLQTFVATIAAAVFLAVAGLLGAGGWRTPFWLYLVAALLVVPMARLLWQPRPQDTGPARRRDPVPWRPLLVPCLVTLFAGVVFNVLIVELPFVLVDIGVTATSTIGTIAAVMSIGSAAGTLAFVAGLVRRTPRLLLSLEFGFAAVGIVVVSATDSVALVTVGAALAGLGTGALIPTTLTWTINRLRFEHRGRGAGLFTSAIFIGEFLSPLLVAALVPAVGGLRGALAVVGVASAVVAAAAATALRRDNPALDVTAT